MHRLESATYCAEVDDIAELSLNWNALENTVIVISGASGLIGTFLVDVIMRRNATHRLNCTIWALARDMDRLLERFDIYGDNPGLNLGARDLAMGIGLRGLLTGAGVDEIDPDPGRIDYVIHAASVTHPRAYASEPIDTIMTNVQGTYAMLDLAASANARRALLISSVEIYGENRDHLERLKETDLGYIDCNTLRAGYPEAKRVSEALGQAFAAERDLEVVATRLPRVFGPTLRADDSKASSQFLFAGMNGRDIVLRSDGQQFYSYCHVADAVSAILTTLLSGEPGQAYNVADPGFDIRLRDLAALIADQCATEVVFETPDDVESRGYSTATRAVMNAAKLRTLGWAPRRTLDEAIESTLTVLREVLP
ncbi:MAG: NAD-dependent epimerase/dehydratase family protein [Propionibacteriaceae bacterium]|nr:NAD-dependent epimerase/dehydratase family protein [Propionibacteriaceae bacterium]